MVRLTISPPFRATGAARVTGCSQRPAGHYAIALDARDAEHGVPDDLLAHLGDWCERGLLAATRNQPDIPRSHSAFAFRSIVRRTILTPQGERPRPGGWYRNMQSAPPQLHPQGASGKASSGNFR